MEYLVKRETNILIHETSIETMTNSKIIIPWRNNEYSKRYIPNMLGMIMNKHRNRCWFSFLQFSQHYFVLSASKTILICLIYTYLGIKRVIQYLYFMYFGMIIKGKLVNITITSTTYFHQLSVCLQQMYITIYWHKNI